MDKATRFKENVIEIKQLLISRNISYEEGINLFMYLIMEALLEDKVNAETNRRKFIEVFNETWEKYIHATKING